MRHIPISAEAARYTDAAIVSRRSVRAFLPRPVPRETIEEILRIASYAPSGTNTQPWKVYVLSGQELADLKTKVLQIWRDPKQRAECQEEYDYYPKQWRSPYIERRRKVGADLYGLLKIGKEDKERMEAQWQRNYAFFDAPVGMFFTIERIMGRGSWLDYGMFLQSLMIAARARGLDTCPQAAFNALHKVVRECVGWGEEEQLVCGMALGYADESRVENKLETEREPVANFALFLE